MKTQKGETKMKTQKGETKMKTVRIALPFVSEVRPLLDAGLTYAQIGEFEFSSLHSLVQNFISKNVDIDRYHDAVCRKFTEMIEQDFKTLIPSTKLEYVTFDEYDVWADFSFEEQELTKVCREHETALQKLLTDLNGSLNNNMTWKDWTDNWTEFDDYTEILQFLIESKPNYKVDCMYALRLLVPFENYINLQKYAQLAEDTAGLATEALLEFMEYKRQTKLTEDRYDSIRAEQVAIVEGRVRDMIYKFEEN